MCNPISISPSAWLAAGLGSLVAFGAGCGSSQPTQQLVDARRAYSEARSSEAARLSPDKLLTAEQALARAEKAHDDDSGSPEEAHLAYLASRKSAIAVAYGKIAAAKDAETQANNHYVSKLEGTARSSESELDAAQSKLAEERNARAEAEKRASAALASLAEVAKVNEERRGTVITLPGGVLFPSGGRDLSPVARQSLSRVADALVAQPESAKILIEGHTDDRGADARNLELSRQRAEAVRSYLLERGLPSERVEAVGKGESAPIADNAASEGRATNRRVEIIVSGADTISQQANPQLNSTPSTSPQPTTGSSTVR